MDEDRRQPQADGAAAGTAQPDPQPMDPMLCTVCGEPCFLHHDVFELSGREDGNEWLCANCVCKTIRALRAAKPPSAASPHAGGHAIPELECSTCIYCHTRERGPAYCRREPVVAEVFPDGCCGRWLGLGRDRNGHAALLNYPTARELLARAGSPGPAPSVKR